VTSGRETLRDGTRAVLAELHAIDTAVFDAVAGSETPLLDDPLRRLSNAANRTALWLASAAVIASVGGRRGRRAGLAGTVALGATSLTVNAVVKQLARRSRPPAAAQSARSVRMPSSGSFPSGHSAAGFAFAAAVSTELPALALPLRATAAAVAYSRVHTGVHYPGDVVAGAVLGGSIGHVVGVVLASRRGRRLAGASMLPHHVGPTAC
jgi:membrane-associated phospholipid phosphatase